MAISSLLCSVVFNYCYVTSFQFSCIFQLCRVLVSISGIIVIAFNYFGRGLNGVNLQLFRAEVMLENPSSLQSYLAA